ncbi:hypothetical protein SAMN02745857_02226 [Andreprevotia lacus DSM 23236]|jgi:hypothetical protein|uniref:Uncharacterized protein n=1 Tax=Andreprevotia lacus DSM 23236 TaxID=1121001 RepID=A0A1W1XP67_9NEIS|nr:hypothetical protein [Andreprevotia lacus]SMC25645.1 hypothetical protein SAMN02745857_02226 [Andreprevotia lacus DSM 23236]
MNPLQTKNQKRDPVDILRVRFWYQGIAKALDCQQSSYQVEKRLEQGRFARKDGRTSYPGKWSGYAQGEHTPQARFVRLFESQAAGSARELHHPLWAILKRIGSQPIIAADWMSRLDPSVQTCVFRPQHDCFGAPRVLTPFNDRQGQKLLRRGDLDALAALVLYWNEAARTGASETQETVAILIYQLLLIVGLEFYTRKLMAELLWLFTTKIFDATPWLNGRFAIDSRSFEISMLLLHRLAHSAEDPGKTPRWRDLVRKMIDLLAGKQGFDICYAMRPVFVPCWDLGPPRYSEWADWEEHRRCWAWGWDCLLTSRIGKFPPDEVFMSGKSRIRIRPGSERLRALPLPTLNTAVIFTYGEWPPV